MPHFTIIRPQAPRLIGIAADRGGLALKQLLTTRLCQMGHTVVDFGNPNETTDDDPDFVIPLARAVSHGAVERGIILCGSGIGAAVTANKVHGVRACLIQDSWSAHRGVEEDQLNMICLGCFVTGPALAWELIQIFLTAGFSGSENQRLRIEKIVALEESEAEHFTQTKELKLMNDDRTTRILSRLEAGFRTDSARLKQMNPEFEQTLRRARELGIAQNFAADWNTMWNQQWVIIELLLNRIKSLVYEMEKVIESNDASKLKEALAAWESIQSEDVHLVESMNAIRQQANALNPIARVEWNLLASNFDANLETIHASSQALRLKLELLTKHTKAEMDVLLQDVLDASDTNAQQWRVNLVELELEKEQHQAGGFLDAVKALFLWVETPEERMRNDCSLRLE
jgi:ribose 5-phosphate isomerase B